MDHRGNKCLENCQKYANQEKEMFRFTLCKTIVNLLTFFFIFIIKCLGFPICGLISYSWKEAGILDFISIIGQQIMENSYNSTLIM